METSTFIPATGSGLKRDVVKHKHNIGPVASARDQPANQPTDFLPPGPPTPEKAWKKS